MRFSWAVVVALVGISVSGLAQQNTTFKVKPSATEKAPKSTAPIGKAGSARAGATANSKDLQALERQTAKTSAPSRSAGKRTPGTAPALKPIKDKPNPPINFNGAHRGKGAASNKQGSNPYSGWLREKGAHH